MEDTYTRHKSDEERGNAVTVRTPASEESVRVVLDEDQSIREKEDFENDRTVRYSDCVRRPADRENVTVRLTDAGFEAQPEKKTPDIKEQSAPSLKFSGGMIDPVAVVLSESGQTHTQMPRVSRGTIPGHRFMKPVGWLVCVEGPDYGESFPLKQGKNAIGRADDMDVVLKKDLAVSRRLHAQIEYLDENRCFMVSAGDARKLVYINDDLLLRPTIMKKNDLLMVGDSSLMLIPCCDERFCWADWDKEE